MSDVPVCGCGHTMSAHDGDGCTTVGCECESVTWHLEMPPSTVGPIEWNRPDDGPEFQ